VSDWISVKDRLPDEDGAYQVRCTHWRLGVITHESVAYEKSTDGEFAMSYAEDMGEEYREITHWMPLPEPPQ